VPRPCRRRSPLRPSHLADRAPSRWGRSVAPHLLPLLLDTVIAMGVFLCFLLALLVSTCSAGGERCVRQDKQAAEFAGKAPWPRRSMGASSPSGGGGRQHCGGLGCGTSSQVSLPPHHGSSSSILLGPKILSVPWICGIVGFVLLFLNFGEGAHKGQPADFLR
jgi:hypothetical protein